MGRSRNNGIVSGHRWKTTRIDSDTRRVRCLRCDYEITGKLNWKDHEYDYMVELDCNSIIVSRIMNS